MKLSGMEGQCLVCGDIVMESYSPSSDRQHCAKGLDKGDNAEFLKTRHLYPTVFPVPSTDNGIFAPPDPRFHPAPDLFAVGMRDGADSAPGLVELPSLPYPGLPTSMESLRCGNAVLHNMGNIAIKFGFSENAITVLDFSTYQWSNTLKDLRSWAVMANAIASGARHLGLWTAGNAGLSLAKLAYTVNRLRSPSDQINVYCYGDEKTLTERIRRRLNCFGAHVEIFESSEPAIYGTDHMRRHLQASTARDIPKNEFWDVTDGLDGVGLYMYRLLGRQIFTHVRPTYTVVPLGTGDLFYGIYLGLQDCLKRDARVSKCKLLGALSTGNSVLKNYDRFGIPVATVERPPSRKPHPCSPKLETVYTPLFLVMHEAFRSENVLLMEFNKHEQDFSANALKDAQKSRGVASEPSALLAFAAARWLSNHHNRVRLDPGRMKEVAKVDVLILNTGFGVLGDQEEDFLKDRFHF